MRSGTIAFLLGILLLLAQPALPDPLWLELLPPCAVLALRRGRWRLPALLACGFLWALLRGALILERDLPAGLEGRDLIVEGRVASLPARDALRTRFDLDVERVLRPARPRAAPGRVRLSWYGAAPALAAGERWRLRIRLKRAHGLSNPGGFDYEAWLFQQGIRSRGYVRDDAQNLRLARAPALSVDALRQRLGAIIAEALRDRPHRGMVAALAIGVREDIREAEWRVLRATGTAHLMAISGLHVGLVAAVAFLLGGRLWAGAGCAPRWLAAPRAAALAACLAAAGYAALAGFSVPTQRALAMVAVAMAGVIGARRFAPGTTLACALLLVLLLDPLAVLAAGFWLSFGAVSVILYGMSGRPGAAGAWWRWGRVQVLLFVGLLPLSLLVFGEHPLTAAPANLLAVPWIGLAVVPVILAGAALALVWLPAGAFLLQCGAAGISAMWPWLEALAGLGARLRPDMLPPLWAGLAGAAGVLILLLPRGTPARWVGLPWLLPLFLLPAPAPAPGVARVTVLDVGQGISAVVRTRRHTLVYDTGPRYAPGRDAGRSVLVPFLRARGIARVDLLILSHGDSDHVGGARSLLQALPVGAVLAGAAGLAPGAARCVRGAAWRWDGVDFRVLHPPPGSAAEGNDASCVLRVAAGGRSLLLPGDIERRAEAELVRAWGAGLHSEVLVAPHHGSLTSSSAGFLDRVRPRYALFSVGYRNRFGFPRPEVLRRYRRRGVRVLDTARQGAITVVLRPGAPLAPPQGHRAAARRLWRDGAQ